MPRRLWSGCVLSETTTDNLAYYDTNIWVAWLFGRSDPFFSQAKALIGKVTSGEKTVVLSHLVIMETIHVLRHKIAKNSRFVDASPGSIRNVEDQIRKNVDIFVRTVSEFARQRQALIVAPNISLRDHHRSVLDALKRHGGQVKTTSGQKYSYKGLGHADLEHVLLAKYSNVREFHSGDKSFEDLKEDSDFKDINFNILQPV